MLLSAAFRLVVGYMPSYPRALAAVVLTAVASAIVVAILRGVLGSGGRLLGIVVQFLAGAAMVNWLLPIQYRRSRSATARPAWCSWSSLLIEIVLGVVLAILAVTLLGIGMASMHG